MSEVQLSRTGNYTVLTIDRPAARNAISRSVMADLAIALDEVGESDTHLLVVTGSGDRVFVSGGDLKELSTIRTTDEAQEMALTMRGVLDRLASLPIPVLGALNGDAFGGGAEVAVACDFRMAADDIVLAFNQISLGIMPAWGGIERLGMLVGRGRAAYLMTSGARLGATQAHKWGLLEAVVPRAEFDARWHDVAEQISGSPRAALVSIKGVLGAAVTASRPDLAAAASLAFAETWVADAHWEAVERMEATRRQAKRDRNASADATTAS